MWDQPGSTQEKNVIVFGAYVPVQVAVDIGANQVGDIATVALLEETDQLLGKNHLFKRSLLLIKVTNSTLEAVNVLECIVNSVSVMTAKGSGDDGKSHSHSCTHANLT